MCLPREELKNPGDVPVAILCNPAGVRKVLVS